MDDTSTHLLKGKGFGEKRDSDLGLKPLGKQVLSTASTQPSTKSNTNNLDESYLLNMGNAGEMRLKPAPLPIASSANDQESTKVEAESERGTN